MEYINPIDSIKINEHILIAKECWPEHFGREIEDINIIKQFYNDSYNLFHEKILTTLNKYHPATWIRIAYIQLEIWTLNFYKARHEDKNFQEVPFLFIPIARYGWRYIIEISLEINQHENNNQDSKIPVQEDINLIFTYLIGLSYCNELSNYLHYFKKHFHNTKLIFNSNIFTKFPELTNETEQFINKIFNYIDVKEIEEEFNYFNNNYILNQIDDFLENQFQFNLKDIDKVIDCLRDDISVSINASNLIIAYPELILLLSEKTRLNISKVKNIVDFIYLQPTGFETTIRGAFPVWEYKQTDALLIGIDISGNWVINNHFSYNGNFAYLIGRNLKTDDYLIDMPPFNTTHSIQYKNRKWKNISLELKSETILKQTNYPHFNFETNIVVDGNLTPVTVDISTPTKAYSLLHFQSECRFSVFKNKTITTAFSVQNLLNTNYRDYLNRQRFYADEMGRNFQIQLKINY